MKHLKNFTELNEAVDAKKVFIVDSITGKYVANQIMFYFKDCSDNDLFEILKNPNVKEILSLLSDQECQAFANIETDDQDEHDDEEQELSIKFLKKNKFLGKEL